MWRMYSEGRQSANGRNLLMHGRIVERLLPLLLLLLLLLLLVSLIADPQAVQPDQG